MLKRSLVFQNPVKLSLKNTQLVVTYADMPESNCTVPIEDVAMVLVDNPMVTVTVPLVNALTESNVSLVYCNAKGMPSSMLLNLDGGGRQCEILNAQINCGEVLKKRLWKSVVETKIKNQYLLLQKLGKDGAALKSLYTHVFSGDADNKEGQAAHLYFKLLFGRTFVRNRDQEGINVLLNYGYTILRAAAARAMISSGIFLGLGIHHHNRANAFPLVDDMMEVFRPYVDEIVYWLVENDETELNKHTKASLISLLYCDTKFGKITHPLQIGLSMVSASLAKSFLENENLLNSPEMK